MLKVTLNEEENQLADQFGRVRQQRAIADGRRDRHGFKGDPLAIHVFGVACEIAVYKALGLTWVDTPYRKGERDLPNGLEIRGRQKHSYELLVWTSDHADRGYILVTKEPDDPEYRIHGFMLGEDAMQDKYKKQVTSRPASFFIPPADLIPIEDLLTAINDT